MVDGRWSMVDGRWSMVDGPIVLLTVAEVSQVSFVAWISGSLHWFPQNIAKFVFSAFIF
jgi:hypothetical protein